MTLEITLMMPFILGVILLVIYVWVQRYNVGLMDQYLICAVMEDKLQGGADTGDSQTESLISRCVNDRDTSLFLLWSINDSDVSSSGGRVKAMLQGKSMLQLPNFDLFRESSEIEIKREYEAYVLRPSVRIRSAEAIRAGTASAGTASAEE